MNPTPTPTIFHYYHRRLPNLIFLFFLSTGYMWAQQGQLECNTYIPWVDNATFTVGETHDATGAACWDEDLLCEFGDGAPSNAVDSDLNNRARGNITALGSLTLRVTESGASNYSAGNFVGFRIANSGLNLGVLNSTTMRTYLNGSLQETVSGADLLAVGLNLGGDIFDIGFITTEEYDAIEITVSAAVALGFFDVYYAFVADFCEGPELDCNIQTPMNLPEYPMAIDFLNTGTSGVGVGSVTDAEDAISESTTDFANLTTIANIAGSIFISIEEQLTDYPAGTFAGFDIENLTVAGADLLNNIFISTYLDGDIQETQSGTNLLLGAPLLSSDGRHVVGFVTTMDFDEVRLTLTQPLNVTLGTTRVYSAIFREFCPGDPLECNTLNAPTLPEYPLFIDDEHTGITGVACVGCSVNNSDRVIDDNPDNFATITLTVAALNVGSLAVKDQLNTYPAGTFAGYRIENPVLVDANVLEGITISLYNDGNFVESQTNIGTLVAVGTGLLVNTGEHIIGFVSSAPFDEVKISLSNTANVDLGTTLIYNLIIEPFCAAEIECDTTYYLTNPGFPVYIDAQRTGIDGVVCALCEVENEQNLLTESNTDFATITLGVNALASGSIAVTDALYTYPAGTFAGFVIEDPGFLVEAELLEILTVSTYNNGDFVESRTGADLLDLGVIILFISADQGRYNIGFQATQPFDEIRITTGSLLTAINEIRVYAAFVDTRASNGGSLSCIDGLVAEDDVATTDEDMPVVIDVLQNDESDLGPFDDPTIEDEPEHGTTEVDEEDGTITYTPDPDFVGVDTFTYSVCDEDQPTECDMAEVIVTVEPVTDTIEQSLPSDSMFVACANDLTTYNSPTSSIMVCNPPPGGEAVVNGSCVTYTPDPGFMGDDVLCVVSCNPVFPTLCDTTIILIEVTAVLPPDAVDDEAETDEETPVNIDVLDNDSDPDSPLGTPTISDPPAHGDAMVEPDGTITYTPDSNFVGLDTFEYTICDAAMPPSCDAALVIVLVHPVTDTIRDTIPGDSTLTLCAEDLTTFTEPATGIEVCDEPANGTVTVNVDCVTYEPDINFSGSDTVCLVVCHPDSADLCDTTIVVITVTPVNDPPVAVDDVAETEEDVPVVIEVLDNDSDPDSPLGTPVVVTGPENGTAMVNNMDNTIIYTPGPDFVGLDTFTYAICDDGMPPLCDTASVIVTVLPARDTIIEEIPQDSVGEWCASEIVDLQGAVDTMIICMMPDSGMVMLMDSCITYVPDPDFTSGTDTMCVIVCDSNICDTAVIIVMIECPAITLKVFLEGPYDSGSMTMSTTLNEFHVLPGQDPDESSNPGAQLLGVAAPPGQPYDTAPWNWNGTEGDIYGDGPAAREYPATVTDWVLISIREDNMQPSNEIWKCAGLLHNDGVVEFPPDCACAQIVDGETYHIVVEHRNHLPVISPAIIAADHELAFDFTMNQSHIFAFGSGQKQIGTKYAMYAGNSEQITVRVDINASDDAVWLSENGTIFQYKIGDHNLDGDVNATDEFVWLVNNGTFTLLGF